MIYIYDHLNDNRQANYSRFQKLKKKFLGVQNFDESVNV